MRFEVQQVPVEAVVVIPFPPLAELAPHKQKLLSGLGKHVRVKKAQVRESLPQVAGHSSEQGALSVNDLVMRQRQEEVFVKRVDDAKRQFVVVILAVYRI